MKQKVTFVVAFTLLLVFSVSIAFADATDLDGDYPWRNHAEPLDFTFGNMIDTHQQSYFKGLVKDAQEQYYCPDQSKCTLRGFIYIEPTGVYEGVPVAQKANCNTGPCIIGWVVKAVWVTDVKLIKMGPRTWLIEEDQIPKEPGYSHFQWVGPPGKPHGLIVGEEYDGFLMKRIAPAPFFWLGGSGSGGGGGGCGGHTVAVAAEDDCGDEGGCGGGGGNHGGGPGRYVSEGVDSHSNIITDLNQTPPGGGCED